MSTQNIQNFAMADVSLKKENFRRAVASGIILCGQEAFNLLINKKLPKGDAFAVAEIAAILATKNTPALIPLCHPLEILKTHVSFEPFANTYSVKVNCEVSAFARTGVEMEALAGASAALLSLYDLLKPIEPALEISSIKLDLKEGGKSGVWERESYLQNKKSKISSANTEINSINTCLSETSVGVITISDTCFKKVATDLSGPTLIKKVTECGGNNVYFACVPDEIDSIIKAIDSAVEKNSRIILLTGGTGLGARDVTPEALLKISEKEIVGFGELMRINGAKFTQNSWSSRSLAVAYKNAIVIAFPGKPAACEQNFDAISLLLKHSLHMIDGKKHSDDLREKKL